MSRSFHMALNIEADYRKWGKFVTHEGRPVTAYEFERFRAECKAKGWEVFPPCDSIDEKTGRCAGHGDDE